MMKSDWVHDVCLAEVARKGVDRWMRYKMQIDQVDVCTWLDRVFDRVLGEAQEGLHRIAVFDNDAKF